MTKSKKPKVEFGEEYHDENDKKLQCHELACGLPLKNVDPFEFNGGNYGYSATCNKHFWESRISLGY